MKKAAVAGGVVVALAASVVGGAVYIGQRTQAQIQGRIAQLKVLAPALEVVEDHYERGLFSAAHTVTLSLGCPLLPAEASGDAAAAPPKKESVLLTIRERIQHGPLPGFSNVGAAVIESELVGSPASPTVAWGSEKQPPITARTQIGLMGGLSSRIAVAPGQITAPTGARMEWQSFTADVKASSTDIAGPWSYEFESPGSRVQVVDDNATMQVQFGATKVRGDVDAGGSLWLRTGKSHGELASMELAMQPKVRPAASAASEPAGESAVEPASAAAGAPPSLPAIAVKLAKLAFSSEMARDKADLISASSTIGGEGLVGDTKLDKFEMQATLKRLHAPSYESLIEHMLASPCGTVAGAASPKEKLAQLQKDALQLLPHNPEYSLDKLIVEIGGKRGEVSYAFGIDGMTAEDAELPLAALASKVKASGKAKLPRAWVVSMVTSAGERFGGKSGDPAIQAEMMNMMLDQAATNGYIARDGDMLSSSFTLANGRVLVNGKEIGRPAATQ